jgi:hypothetical protein
VLKAVTMKIEILSCISKTQRSTCSGTLSIQMNGRANPEKVSSTKDSDSMLRDHSTFPQHFHLEDIRT